MRKLKMLLALCLLLSSLLMTCDRGSDKTAVVSDETENVSRYIPTATANEVLVNKDTVELEESPATDFDLGGEGAKNKGVITPISQLKADTSFSLSFTGIDTLYIMNPSLMLEITNTLNDTNWVTEGIPLGFNLFEKYISGEKIERSTAFEPKKQ
jgi:hypothetical protein